MSISTGIIMVVCVCEGRGGCDVHQYRYNHSLLQKETITLMFLIIIGCADSADSAVCIEFLN